MKNDLPEYIKISKIVDETLNVKTFYFEHKLQSLPGQFVMLWIPGMDQKPFSIGYDNGDELGLTIFAVGPFSKKLFEYQVGDRVGITGPYGTPFSVRSKIHYIMVAGGYGAAPLGYLAEEVAKRSVTVDFCVGARNAQDILFENRCTSLEGVKVHVSTDDGSKGHKGYVTDILTKLLDDRSTKDEETLITTCGPELMEKKVLDICNDKDVNCEISIERYMKCGFGVCGSCVVDPIGICTCTRGPVISREVANQISEFGVYHRNKAGNKVFF